MKWLNKCTLILIFILSVRSGNGNVFSFVVEDTNGNTIDLISIGQNHLIICFHYYNCIGCFKIIQRLEKKYRNFKICFLARVTRNEFSLKQRMEFEIKKKLSKFYRKEFVIYYDVHKEEDPWPPINLKEGIFGKYKISKTPAYFVLTKDTLIFVPYEQIEKELSK